MSRIPAGPSDELPLKEAEQLDPEDYCSAKELADYWGVSKHVVLMAARRGSITGCFKVGGHWYFHKQETIDGWQPLAVRKEKEAEGTLALDSNGPKSSSTLISSTHKKTQAVQKLRYLRELSARVTPSKWAAICDKAIEQAIDGDRHARNWISDHLMGRPIQRVEVDADVQLDMGFEEGERVRAIQALLDSVLARKEAEVVDVEPKRGTSSSNSD